MDRSIFETYAGLEGRQLLEPILRDFAGRAAVVSSFGAESAVLLHMVARGRQGDARHLPRYGQAFLGDALLPRQADRPAGPDRRAHHHAGRGRPRRAGPRRHAAQVAMPTSAATSARRCRWQKALEGFDVTISGRKRYHGAARATLDFLSIADGRLKVEPLAGFSALDINAYMKAHDLPRPSADRDRLFLDRLRALHAAWRLARRPARRPLGGHGQRPSAASTGRTTARIAAPSTRTLRTLTSQISRNRLHFGDDAMGSRWNPGLLTF